MSEPKRTWRDSIEIPEKWEWAEAINWLLCAGVVLVMGALLALTVFRELIENGRWFPLAILVALLAVALRAVVLDFYRHRLRLVTAGLLAIWFGATAMVWLGVLKFR